jgi:hypothetical protein
VCSHLSVRTTASYSQNCDNGQLVIRPHVTTGHAFTEQAITYDIRGHYSVTWQPGFLQSWPHIHMLSPLHVDRSTDCTVIASHCTWFEVLIHQHNHLRCTQTPSYFHKYRQYTGMFWWQMFYVFDWHSMLFASQLHHLSLHFELYVCESDIARFNFYSAKWFL